MSEPVLKEALLQIIAHRRSLEDREITGRGTVSAIKLFDTILKSKYGDIYRELVRAQLFDRQELTDVTLLCNLWIEIHTSGRESDPYEIEQLLGSERPRQDKATGALLMMEWTYKLDVMREHPEKTAASAQDKVFFQTIFGAVLKLLLSDDRLLQFAAAWCIAWGGYNERNIIPEELYQETMDRLLALWLGTESPLELKRMISWAVFSMTCPLVTVQKSDALTAALDKNLTQPSTDFDSIAAAILSVRTGCWGKEQFQQWWDKADFERVQLHMEDERYLHDINYLTADKNKNTGTFAFD